MPEIIEKDISPATLRAEIARANIPRYHLAAFVSVNPARLGSILNEKLPMPEGLAEKIMRILDQDKKATTKRGR